MSENSPSSEQHSASKARLWQSLEERKAATPFWQTPEFEKTVEEMKQERATRGFNRRDFLKFMGAGAVMAQAACRRPTEQIVPAVIQPAEMTPGQPLYYSTTAPDGTGLVVKTREGRPIKLAGNPEHPLTRGAVSAYEAAGTMDLYDPDRLRRPVRMERKGTKRRRKNATETEIVAEAQRKLKEGYVLLTGPIEGLSSRRLVADFLRAVPRGRHVEFRADPSLRQISAGQEASYGRALVPTYRLHKADYILSIDADFLGTLAFPGFYGSSFGRARDVRRKEKKMARLVVFESMMSLTGTNADERYAIRPGDQLLIALAIAAELAVNQNRPVPGGPGGLRAYTPQAISAALGQTEGLFAPGTFKTAIAKIASELWAHQGRSVVISGSPLAATGDELGLQVAVNLLNSMLGNDGRTVDHAGAMSRSPGADESDILKLFRDLGEGRVKNIVIAGANPVYHLPASSGVAAALQKASFSLALADRIDETAELCSAVLPLSHYLESWGDFETVPGVRSIQQPVIRPLYASRSIEDWLIQLAGGALAGVSSFHDLVKSSWASLARGPADRFWVSVLQAGYFTADTRGLDADRPPRAFQANALSKLPTSIGRQHISKAGTLKVGLYYNAQVLDGAGANNAYRQELPEPVTKVVWGNHLTLLPSTARRLGLRQGSVVEATVGARKVSLAVYLQPGLHPDAALIALGYGRTAGGRTSNGLGVNALDLLEVPKRGELRFSGAALALRDTGSVRDVVNTQTVYRSGRNTEDKAPFAPQGAPNAPLGSSSQQVGLGSYDRPIVRELSYKDFRNGRFGEKPEEFLKPAAVEAPPREKADIMTSWEYTGLRWHMSIDLNACTGCAACVTSCNTENNIPVVGPEEVARGREMQWMRIDRYYRGDESSPEVVHQPMLCQHCENAPCENVCPVAATVHNSEGLNVMAYNRCVGTRYCSNNCPYKVRRFNWFENWRYMEGLEQVLDIRTTLLHWGADFRPRFRAPQHLGLNPDVTVRSRGVMEKCTFCIHRIATARQDMKALGEKRMRDGAVRTACQEVCPTNAITFGDRNDNKSEIHHVVENTKTRDPRGYQVLDFLGVRPSITYLAKVRNKT